MDRESSISRGHRLAELHAASAPLVLPTVWDVWSARTVVAAGFEALTIGSHPLADSRGAADHEGQQFDEVIAAARSIVDAVEVPVSIDLESGYGKDPDELIAGLLAAGGVGLNVEDTVHSEGGRVRTTEEHATYVAGLRSAADATGIPVWINGRTDLFLHAQEHAADPAAGRADVLDEAIARMRALAAAGANSVYPVRIQDDDAVIRTVASALSVPVNCTAHPARHSLARFAGLGVGRITFGPYLQAALTDATRTLLEPWR